MPRTFRPLLLVPFLGLAATIRSAHALEPASLLAQADAAYAQREDLTQAKLALAAYEKCPEWTRLAEGSTAPIADTARLGQRAQTTTAECFWKAARAAWWVGEHEKSRADRLAGFQRGPE